MCVWVVSAASPHPFIDLHLMTPQMMPHYVAQMSVLQKHFPTRLTIKLILHSVCACARFLTALARVRAAVVRLHLSPWQRNPPSAQLEMASIDSPACSLQLWEMKWNLLSDGWFVCVHV